MDPCKGRLVIINVSNSLAGNTALHIFQIKESITSLRAFNRISQIIPILHNKVLLDLE